MYEDFKKIQMDCMILIIININYTELLANISSTKLDKIIKEIVIQIEYSPENYAKLWEKSKKITDENQQLTQRNKQLSEELHRTKHEFHTHIKQNKPSTDGDRKHVRRFQKNKDGMYDIDNHTYPILSGTREQVWDNVAYRTEGGLIKSDFMINSMNKIVSKSKSISSKTNIRPICQKKQTHIDESEVIDESSQVVL